MFLGQIKFVLGPGWQAKKKWISFNFHFNLLLNEQCKRATLCTNWQYRTWRSHELLACFANFVARINKFVIVWNNHLVDGFCLQIITFKLEEKGSKTIILRALQNGSLFYNCLRAFDHSTLSQATVLAIFQVFLDFWENLTCWIRET